MKLTINKNQDEIYVCIDGSEDEIEALLCGIPVDAIKRTLEYAESVTEGTTDKGFHALT